MVIGRITRRVTTVVLIAMLVPAPGLAWQPRSAYRSPVDRMIGDRLFAEAMNSFEQSAANIAPPQIYILFGVDVPLQPAGSPPLLNAGFVDEVMKGIAATPEPAPATATATAGQTGLAAMPNALRYAGGPDDSASAAQQTMRVAIRGALQNAGLDADGTFTSNGKSVTYDDGEIKVTGTLVDGRIDLTKELTPPTAAPAVAPQMSVLTYNQGLAKNLENKVKVITPNQTSTVLMGQVLTRDTYVAQLENTATNIETLLKDPVQLDSVVRGLRNDAAAVDNAYQNMLGAEQSVRQLQGRNSRVNLQSAYDDSMRQAQQLEAKGDAAGAGKIRQAARDTAYGHYVDMRQLFYQALDQNPLLGLGERNTFRADDFLFKGLRNTLSYDAPNSDYVALTRTYLEKGAAEARKEVNRVSALTTADQFNEFGGAKYERTRITIAAQGGANGSTFPRELTRAAEGGYESVAGDKAVTTEIENFGLNLIAGTAWVIPGIGPFISTGAAAIQVVRDGNELWIAVLDAEDARKTAGTTGYTRIITEEDRVAAKRDQFAISMAGLALEGLSHVSIVKGPLKTRGAGAATEAAETGAGSARRAVAPPAEPPSLPTRLAPDAELEARNVEELMEMDQVYAENVKRARAAGLSEDRIRQLTARGGGAGHEGAINALYLESLKAEGKEIMSVDEYILASGFETKNKLGTLTEAEYDWLRGKLAEDPHYLDRLPNRGRMSGADGFVSPVRQDLLDELMKNPRVAQMSADAKAAAGAADATGTVIVPAGATNGAPAGTPTVTMDPTKTALVDNADTTGTVRLDPADATPTVILNRADATPTVLLDPADAAPTVRIDSGKTVTMDPNKTALTPPVAAPMSRANAATVDRVAGQVSQDLQKAQQSGRSAQDVVKDLRASMTQLGVSPQQLVNSLAPRLMSQVAKPVSLANVNNASAAANGVNVAFEALGVSSGEAFKMTAVNSGSPVQLHGSGVVVEPVIGAPATSTPIRPPANVSTTAAVVQNVEAFCLERLRPVASPGTQYRVAPPAVQAQHHKLLDILHAAQRVNAVGGLRPDSDVNSYFNFVRQWSIWSKQESFDQKTFTEEFLNQTKKNVEAKNMKWTDDMKNTVRKAAPGRWRDISSVLNEANQPKIRAAAHPQMPGVFSSSMTGIDRIPASTWYVRRRERAGELS